MQNKFQRIIANAVHGKQMLLGECTPSSIQYLSFLVESLEIPYVSFLSDCQPLPCAPNSSALLDQLTMLLDILES